ncbi:hypothetical protein B0H13DRAFT_1876668 [Mycena leptocephala]|nr:hypothetical protein B0H13DRAFT_1876668 [Mycena leptocephala]
MAGMAAIPSHTAQKASDFLNLPVSQPTAILYYWFGLAHLQFHFFGIRFQMPGKICGKVVEVQICHQRKGPCAITCFGSMVDFDGTLLFLSHYHRLARCFPLAYLSSLRPTAIQYQSFKMFSAEYGLKLLQVVKTNAFSRGLRSQWQLSESFSVPSSLKHTSSKASSIQALKSPQLQASCIQASSLQARTRTISTARMIGGGEVSEDIQRVHGEEHRFAERHPELPQAWSRVNARLWPLLRRRANPRHGRRASTYVPDPNAHPGSMDPNAPPVRRHLTFWRDSFTVEDGLLMQYDNAEYAEVLGALHSRAAPPAFLCVRAGQRLEGAIENRTGEAVESKESKEEWEEDWREYKEEE